MEQKIGTKHSIFSFKPPHIIVDCLLCFIVFSKNGEIIFT
jgi:hypothetical protein